MTEEEVEEDTTSPSTSSSVTVTTLVLVLVVGAATTTADSTTADSITADTDAADTAAADTVDAENDDALLAERGEMMYEHEINHRISTNVRVTQSPNSSSVLTRCDCERMRHRRAVYCIRRSPAPVWS